MEETLAMKQWSSAQSYEISDLKNRIEALKNSRKGDVLTTIDFTRPKDPIPTTTPTPLSYIAPIQPMGQYDGLCINNVVHKNINKLVDDKELNTYMGSTIPLKIEKTVGGLEGPSIDGDDLSPKKLSMFSNNESSISCCGDSGFFTSTGCICLTDKQENYINNRGGNHVLEENYECPV